MSRIAAPTGPSGRAPSSAKLAVLASDSSEAQTARSEIMARYDTVAADKADVIVALGGDGFMLQTLHQSLTRRQPVYGMNRGTVGFLANAYTLDDLPQRIAEAEPTVVSPLRMRAVDCEGVEHVALAFNEVSLLRETRQTAKLRIFIDGRERLEELICDGALVATPAGSTAYNLSAHGPILPIGAQLMALTPISAFRPRRWRGALLPNATCVRFEVLEARKRPVSAVADFHEVRDVRDVRVETVPDQSLTLLFDQGHSLDERLIREQFLN